MKTITVPTAAQVSTGSQDLFAQIKHRLGKLPNLYATMGYSEHALKGFLELEATLAKGVFHPREREAIALVVSEVNGCEYCLSAHSMLAMKAGFTQAETLELRAGNAVDAKVHAIVALAKSISETKGNADPALLDNFFAQGFDEAALMELMGLITVRVFTNYVYAMTHIPIDFPVAQPLS